MTGVEDLSDVDSGELVGAVVTDPSVPAGLPIEGVVVKDDDLQIRREANVELDLPGAPLERQLEGR
jgi:hypothetical protein